MKKIHVICMLLVGLFITLQACDFKPKPSEDQSKTFRIADLFWLIGEWYRISDGGAFEENWVKVNDSLLTGKTIVTEGLDTLMTEEIMITLIGNELVYIPTVSGQNNGKPVVFACTSNANNTWVFVNPTHDFPQFITYKKINADSLVASISGISNGKPQEILFPMKRKTTP